MEEGVQVWLKQGGLRIGRARSINSVIGSAVLSLSLSWEDADVPTLASLNIIFMVKGYVKGTRGRRFVASR